MDFTYHYTEEQERFRREVVRYLDAALAELGREPVALGGGGLTADDAVVLLEELARRGLLGPVGEAAGLRQALHEHGTDEQRTRFLLPVARGETLVWRPLIESGGDLDPTAIGVRARVDGDDFILDGEGGFVGPGSRPGLLLTLALGGPDLPPAASTLAFLVPGGLDGIGVHTPRLLVAGASHRVTFDGVRVPRSCLLGREGDGWDAVQAGLSMSEASPPALDEDAEVGGLLRYAAETTREGELLKEQPPLQQLLMEAVINSRVARLFRMRDAWMRETGRPMTYEATQTAAWERRASMRLSGVVRDVVGIHALLDASDPDAAGEGGFELQQRRSLAELNPTGTVEYAAATIARHLRLGERKHGRR